MFGNKASTGVYYTSNPAQQDNRKRLYIFGGLGIIIIISILMPILGSLGDGLKNDIMLLNAEQSNLEQLTSKQAVNINSYDLTNANATLSTLVTSDYIAVSNLLANSYNISQLSSQAIESASTNDSQTLQQASTLDHFDSTYRQVLLTRLDAIKNQATKILSENPGPHTRADLGRTLKNIQAASDELNTLTALQ